MINLVVGNRYFVKRFSDLQGYELATFVGVSVRPGQVFLRFLSIETHQSITVLADIGGDIKEA